MKIDRSLDQRSPPKSPEEEIEIAAPEVGAQPKPKALPKSKIKPTEPKARKKKTRAPELPPPSPPGTPLPPSSAEGEVAALAVVRLYHELLPGLTKSDVQKHSRLYWLVVDRWSERPEEGFWRDYFTRVSQSPFLTGESRDWSATLPWLMKSENMEKVLSGHYPIVKAKSGKHGDWRDNQPKQSTYVPPTPGEPYTNTVEEWRSLFAHKTGFHRSSPVATEFVAYMRALWISRGADVEDYEFDPPDDYVWPKATYTGQMDI